MKKIFCVCLLVLVSLTLCEGEEDFDLSDTGCRGQKLSREECNKKTASKQTMVCCQSTGTNKEGGAFTDCIAVKKTETSINKLKEMMKALGVSGYSVLCSSSYLKIATIVFSSLFFLF